MRNKSWIGAAIALITIFVAAYATQATAKPDRESEASPMGVWDIQGKDERGTRWIATMVILPGRNDSLQGHMDWLSSNGHGGREYFTGNYNPRTHLLKMVGSRVELPDNIVRGKYSAHLSQNGSYLEQGHWSDNFQTAVPGSWSANRIELR